MAKANGEQIALTILARDAAQRVQSYVDRGRQLKGRTDEELSVLLVTAYQVFEQTGFKTQSKQHLATEDVGSEYELRGVKPPYHLVAKQIDNMVAAATKTLEDASEDLRDQINTKMMADYEAIKRSEH